jgi:hypothetical protein
MNGYQKGRARRIRGILEEKGIRVFDKVKDSELVSSFAFNPKGDLFIRMEHYASAMEHYDKMSSIAEKTLIESGEFLNRQHEELRELQKINGRFYG